MVKRSSYCGDIFNGDFHGSMNTVAPAYGNCTCDCHRTPGVHHITACCWPGKDEEEQRCLRNAKLKSMLLEHFRTGMYRWYPTEVAYTIRQNFPDKELEPIWKFFAKSKECLYYRDEIVEIIKERLK
jgi:hypothetical protein